jgi:hypothetical protein
MQLYAEAFTATTHVVAAAAPASPTTQPSRKAPDLARRRQRLEHAAQVRSGKTGGLPAWAMARAAGVARRVELRGRGRCRPGREQGGGAPIASRAAGQPQAFAIKEYICTLFCIMRPCVSLDKKQI